jgi:hypothetical protein
MNVDATVAQIQCIDDGGRRCWAGRCGGNARNRVCRLTTEMRTTQGQAAFGHNVQAIITSLYIVKLFQTGIVGRVFSMRVERTYSRVQTPINKFVMKYLNLRNIPARLSRSAKQHSSKSAHLLRRFVQGLSIYVYQFSIPIDLRA